MCNNYVNNKYYVKPRSIWNKECNITIGRWIGNPGELDLLSLSSSGRRMIWA
jgi:hypothetical protein